MSLYEIGLAQQDQLRAYTLENGLPQSQVYDLLQDALGYLWIGTQGGGLARFDGETFDIWNENNGLLSNYIHALAFKNDSLYIGTKKGLSVKEKGRITNFPGPQVNTIYHHNNLVFLGTARGIYTFQKNTGTLEKLHTSQKLDDSKVNALLYDGKHYWAASVSGLWKLDRSASKTEARLYEAPNFTSLIAYNESIFAATFTDGILVIDPAAPPSEDKLITAPLRINSLNMINGQLWVATDNDGISVIDPDSFQLQKKITPLQGLSVSHIRKSITDRQGKIWIATSGGGLYKYFQNDFTHYDKDSGLPANRVYAVHYSKNKIWISTGEAGLTMIDSSGIHPLGKIRDFSGVKLKTITSDEKGNIWAGSDGKGILFHETTSQDSLVLSGTSLTNIVVDTVKTLHIKNHIVNEERGFPSNWIRKLYVSRDTVWAATYADGIVKFRFDSEKEKLLILNHFGIKDGMRDLLLRDLVAGSEGKLWYSTQSGYLGYIQNDRVTDLGPVLGQQTPVNTILFKKETLFLGTAGEGVWYSKTNDYTNFKKLSGEKNLTSSNSYLLFFDAEENLWMGTEKGIDKIILNSDHEIADVFHFGRNEGFLGIETCLNAVAMDEADNVWFGALYGLTKYEAGKAAAIPATKPILRFEAIEVGYVPVEDMGYEIQTKGDVLQLQPQQDQISFRYRTIDLDHPGAVQYRFKLNNSDWSPWSSVNRQSLAGLAYGAHVFKAQSRNYRWIESEPISFEFYIESPLYMKAWFQWMGIGIGIFSLLLAGLWYVKRIKKKGAAEQEHLKMQNYLLSLEQKALRLQMNPHFIFNVLNGIKGMASGNPEKMNKTINSFAVLLREILYNSRKDRISLGQEINTLTHYIEVEKMMAVRPFDYTIEILSETDPEEILIPPMLIQPFVENAIRHGILKTPKEGRLLVQFMTTKDFLYCTIIDNGPGIYTSPHKAPIDHQSMALTVTRERIASLAGEDSLKITEQKVDAIIEGTKIVFKIPLETDF